MMPVANQFPTCNTAALPVTAVAVPIALAKPIHEKLNMWLLLPGGAFCVGSGAAWWLPGDGHLLQGCGTA